MKFPEIQTFPISKIKPYNANAKQHPQSQIDLLVKQISEGFDQPIVVDKDFVIIKGHGRRLAALQMGLKIVPVIVRDDLSPTQVKAARIADNKLAETDWDDELLRQELESLEQFNYDLADLGFNESELETLLGELQEEEKEETEREELPLENEEKKQAQFQTCPSCGHEF